MRARPILFAALSTSLFVSGLVFARSAAKSHGIKITVSADSLEARRQQLKRLVADEWEFELRESPEQATQIGDYRYNDRWSDYSLSHVPKVLQQDEKFLTAI